MISAIVTVGCLLGLCAAFVLKSTSILIIGFCSLGAYIGIIRWITFHKPTSHWLIPHLFCLVWLIPLIRALIGAGGGPLTWDEMLYMDLARTSAAEPRVLNQYFHIYLLKIFYWLWGSTDFSAVRYYWIAVQTAVLVLVYQSSVILTRRFSAFVSIVSGMAAVLLFCSQPLVMESIGVAYVDFTLELLFTTAAFLLIVADARPSFTRTALVLLGLLFGLGLKTKEVAIILLIPVFGLAWMTRPASSNIRDILKIIGLFAAGVLTGVLAMIALNTIVLSRPMWGFTVQDLQAWFIARTGADPGLKPFYRQSYFTELSSTSSLCCILLIVMILLGSGHAVRTSVYRILSMTIVGFILFYILIPFQAYTRYLIPIYPLLAILAGPAIAELTDGSKIRLAILLMVSLPSILLVWFIMNLIYPGLDPYIFTSKYFYPSIILPVLICFAFLVWLVIPVRFKILRTSLIGLFLITTVMYPLADVYKIIANREPEQLVAERFRIIRQWKPDIHKYVDRQIFISERVDNPKGPLAITPDYARIMLNLALDARLPVGIVTTRIDVLLEDDMNRYCFGILPTREFDALTEQDHERLEVTFRLSQTSNQKLTYLNNPACR